MDLMISFAVGRRRYRVCFVVGGFSAVLVSWRISARPGGSSAPGLVIENYNMRSSTKCQSIITQIHRQMR
jgi:hypothetical protein